jgi:hypothetical protein
MKLSGAGPRIYLQKEAPLIAAGISLVPVCSLGYERHIPLNKVVVGLSGHNFEGSQK